MATPLERHLGAIADVDDMTSTSSVGTTNIQLTFGVDRDIDGAARDVQAAIVAAHADLPSSLTRNPSYRKLNSALFPVMAIAMTSDVLTQGQIYDAADAVISQRLSQIQGVGGVNVNGSALPAVRVEINPLSLSKYGIGLQDVRAAISNANANAPKGAIESDALHYQIYTNDNARDAGPYRNLIIANRNGATVRLGDVATVLDMQDGATENIRTYGLYNGKPAVFVHGVPAARRQHHRNDRRRQGGAAAAQELHRSEDRSGGHLRPLDHDPRLAAPGRADADAGGGDGHPGGLHLPEQLSRRADPRAGGAGVADRHLRRDVPAGLHAGQFLADGAHHRHRLRRGRRHRRHGKHHAAHRGGHDAHAARRCWAREKWGSPSSP